jgi:hypothetical protein
MIFATGLLSAALAALQDGEAKGAIAQTAIHGAVQRGVTILLERQESVEKDGPPAEWPYEGVYRVDGEIPIGYRVGGTAICATALLEAGGRDLPEPARSAIDRALAFVLEGIRRPLMSPGFEGGYDTRGWGHAYALGFLLRLREVGRVPKADQSKLDESVRWLVAALEKTEIGKRGGWNYARGQDQDDAEPSSFMTAPTLQFLFETARQGEKVDRAVVGRALDALDALEKGRLSTGAFQYGIDPEHPTGKGFEAVEGAIGRSPICETTLFLAGRGSVERIRGALDAFFAHWGELEKRRKQKGTHAPPFMIAPYYFFYAHRYAAQAIELLPETERAKRREDLYRLLWKVREEDGGWNDRVFARSECFGTAMSMLALLSPGLPAPARWAGK